MDLFMCHNELLKIKMDKIDWRKVVIEVVKEISNVIMLIEDRISEILESGNLNIKVGCDGLPTKDYMKAHRKNSFLIELSKDLANFDIGRY